MTRKTNKILAATAMLLVSVLMLGTATYAWFAMNTRSVANGLTVEAYSDSNFLEISQDGSDYKINTTFTENNTGLLRLVTHKFMKDGEIVTITATPVTGGRYDGTGTYYKAVDSDKAGSKLSYSYANDELVKPSDTSNYYVDLCFTIVTSDEIVSVDNNTTYYKYSQNTFTGESVVGKSAKGYYTIGHYELAANYVEGMKYYEKQNGKYVEVTVNRGDDVTSYYTVANGFGRKGATATYDGVSAYYENIGSVDAPVVKKVGGLELGSELNGYYTVTETGVTVADATSNGTSIYYLKNEVMSEVEEGSDEDPELLYTDYSYIGTVPNGELLENYLYWGRAYSNDPTKVQENNTLNIINPNGTDADAVTNYYLHKTLYLRQAEGTNNASNLRIEDVRIGGAKNELSNALRVLFVAYSEHDEDTLVTYTYDPANDNGAESQRLFSTLLGNEAETITVEVYIYFDGTDADANNKQVAGAVLNGQTVEIEFAIDELPYNQ